MMEGKRILVVDDHEDIREMLTLRLSSQGYVVETAVNGQEALDKARAGMPDLVVADVQMPEMDGFTMLKELKRLSREINPGSPGVPVIIMTGAKKGPEVKALFEMEGVNEYLEKPVEGKMLLSKIKALLEQSPS